MKSIADRNDALHRALRLGKEKHPQAPQEHHLAFANSVAFLTTGWIGGFGEPSMRQHLACKVAQSKGEVEFDFFGAAAAVEEACYGPITLEHAKILAEEEYCVGDAPGEKEAAEQLLFLYQGRN